MDIGGAVRNENNMNHIENNTVRFGNNMDIGRAVRKNSCEMSFYSLASLHHSILKRIDFFRQWRGR
jgi:hypothetical protein